MTTQGLRPGRPWGGAPESAEAAGEALALMPGASFAGTEATIDAVGAGALERVGAATGAPATAAGGAFGPPSE